MAFDDTPWDSGPDDDDNAEGGGTGHEQQVTVVDGAISTPVEGPPADRCLDSALIHRALLTVRRRRRMSTHRP